MSVMVTSRWMADQAEFKVTAYGRLLFSLTNLIRIVQSSISWTFSVVFIAPLFLLMKNAKYGVPGASAFEYQINLERPFHRIVYWLWMKASSLQFWMSGMIGGEGAYRLLMRWNLDVPIVGYRRGKTLKTIEYLGPKRKDSLTGEEYQGANIFWINRPKYTGEIKLLSRRTTDNETGVEIVGAWLEGDFVGKTFVLNANDKSLPTFEEKNDYRPCYIYVTPKWLILGLAVLGSIWQFGGFLVSHWERVISVFSGR